MSVAQEILNQLGGNKFIVMTGAKNLVDCGNGLAVKFPRVKTEAGQVNYMKVKLNGMDLYDVEYGYIRGANYKVQTESNGLYNDMLVKDFENTTGLYTRLF